ncbi:MAG: hypothetical protein LBE38_10805 [Deltaproteobacteria bacterium]|jgi:ubiquinone biosynthesis protein|nr:hypothetical protein [Deltaproteobacteria bacterium]
MPSNTGPFAKISLAYRHVERITELMKVMVKFGFGDLFASLGLGDIILRVKRLVGFSRSSAPPSTRARRMRLALEEMGLVYIKLGQYLSTRHDVLPQEYVEEFSLLQDNVPPIPFSEVQKIIQDNIDTSAFQSIAEETLAAASVGQVHDAVLVDGSKVVLKVQRPGLRKLAQTDLEILHQLAVQAEKYIPNLQNLHPIELVEEFRRSLFNELNYRLEAGNILRMHRLYARREDVKIPALRRSLTTDTIIVMEKIEGIKIDDLDALKMANINLAQLARLTAKVALEQIMLFGFFHADPHPGNIFAQKGPKVAFIDFGLIGQLNSKTRDELLRLALGVVRHKPSAIARAALRICSPTIKVDREKLEIDIQALLDTHLYGTLKDINLNAFLQDIIEVLTQHQLRTPPDLLLLVKALIQYETLGIKLDQGFDIMEEARPLITSLYKRRYSPRHWLSTISRQAEEFFYNLQNLPADLGPFFNTLKKGKIKAELEEKSLPSINNSINRSSYRVAFAMILSSFLIGSSMIIATKTPPLWHGISVIGIFGLTAAFILGLWLAYDYFWRKY